MSPIAAGTILRPLNERFEAKVERTDDCWLWTGARSKQGYGVLRLSSSEGLAYAHRLAYELHVGPIPVGLTLDHLCHTRDATCPGGPSCPHRACVNPAHLEPVSDAENIRRGARWR